MAPATWVCQRAADQASCWPPSPARHDGPAQVIMPAIAGAVRQPGQNCYLADGAGIPGLIITPSLDAALSRAEATVVRQGPHARHLRRWWRPADGPVSTASPTARQAHTVPGDRSVTRRLVNAGGGAEFPTLKARHD